MDIESFDHVGIRVGDVERAMWFYTLFGFVLEHRAENDAVVVMKNRHGVEINLVYNANDDNGGKNILMDVPRKYAGYTHVAFRVSSVADTLAMLRQNDIRITQGPVSFGRDGHVSLFVRDPDRNVIELRGREEDLSRLQDVEAYEPKN
jgi:catechol 2,3-dioxygenase-like lactoylglutathione lyase family enzyme